jgi:hypothetical protein
MFPYREWLNEYPGCTAHVMVDAGEVAAEIQRGPITKIYGNVPNLEFELYDGHTLVRFDWNIEDDDDGETVLEAIGKVRTALDLAERFARDSMDNPPPRRLRCSF